MDTFESSLSSFENPADQHNFIEFFNQQQVQQQQQPFTAASLAQASNPHAAPSQSNNNINATLVPTAASNGAASSSATIGPGGFHDFTSPTTAVLRSSASPTSYEHLINSQGDALTASESPSSSQTSALGSTSKSIGTSGMYASTQQLHPMSTPIRHHSLPYDPSQQQGQQSRFIAGPSSRQISMGSPSSNPASPSLMRPLSAGTGGVPSNYTPNGSEFLIPVAPMATSPSPLRTNLPFSTQSPEDSARRSPTTTLKNEDGGKSQMVPSQTPQNNSSYTMYANGDNSSNLDTPNQGGSGDGFGGSGAASTKFVHKLFRMVSDAEYQHLISWNASGTSVVVTNFDEFAKEVLGKHFKHSNFSSFIRQLNMYGFYKVNKTPRGHRHAVDTQIWEFSHPKFIRGHPEMLDDIRRKALDSEHARVEARDLQYSVSVGHMQLRQQVDEQQYRIEELFEMNMAMRQVVSGLRDTLHNVQEWVKVNHGGQLPFENRLPLLDLPPTPMMHPYMQEAPSWGAPGQNEIVGGDGPPIFVTEPSYGGQMQHQQQPSPHDVFSMSAMGQVSPLGSRRVSTGSQQGERMDGSSNGKSLTIDTQMQFGNPGLGVMGLASPMTNQMNTAINTPLPPSPAVHGHPHMAGYMADTSPFLASPSMASFPSQGGYFTTSTMVHDDDDAMFGPNSKAMRTQMKRTASNSGQHQMHAQAAAMQNQQQKRKSPGI
ncbi:hypothetical protein CBS101457_005122 [Exobasidium rhododendri]|nr:hypothetical protein CBS101457_005122 [Exobasidium rhododendri]